ncbi:MAG TPA: hypothetical protein IAA69_08350 [Candidatus Aveggerthella stercoripullorum]|uniref:ASCH domain-containing protein n=1 Tax=Candidatus Aveggerthella stercoripullorum TaxID=2840688 RepID=A0A9D1D556_9ACTN|nr:hypothetical protein [Candidatus Aveggerthella stercoripullorum]
MKENFAETMPTKRFMVDLACGRFDSQDDMHTVAVVATSSHDDAEVIREVAGYRGIAKSVLVSEFDDVSNSQRPTAITEEAAAAIHRFLASWDFESTRFLFVCDGSVSRSAAMLCAWMRLCGEDDLPLWADAQNCSPNVLVYGRLLAAGGEQLSEAQLSERELLKDMVLGCKVAGRKSHAMHLLEKPWRQIRDGEKRCELRRLDAKRKAVAPGDLVVFSRAGLPDELLVVRVTECRTAGSIEKLLLDDDVLSASGFATLEDAVAGMGEIYGDDPYEALGIFLDASDWVRGMDACRRMPKQILDSMHGSAVMRDYFADGMK